MSIMKQETQSPSVPIQMAIMGGLPSKKQERLLRLKDFLNSNYELRFNVVSRQTEVRLKYSKDDFTDVTKRTLNGIVNNAIERGGLEISDRDVSRMIESAYAPDFHPMTSYVSSLPDWDGVDRVTPLAQRISPQELWVKVFHIWMRAMTAQWMGTETECANTLVPVLVSREQGMRKSSFCRLLVPDSLKNYYHDKVEFSANSHYEERLAKHALINLDEFDRISPALMPNLKNALQMKEVCYRKLCTNDHIRERRMASFIGTSNVTDLLTDESGSRRFMVQEVDHIIDCTPLEHKQIFAQLRHEIRSGERCYLTRDEEREMEEHNRVYYKALPEAEVFWKCFRRPDPDEQWTGLSSAEIVAYMKRRFPSVTQGFKPRNVAIILSSIGVEKVHRKTGNVFQVVPI